MSAAYGNIAPGAIVGGRKGMSEPFYIGRARYNKSRLIGRIEQNKGGMYIPCDGKECKIGEYEVLVKT